MKFIAFKKRIKIEEPKCCPCCGSDDIYTGALSSLKMGVECRNCKLTIGVGYQEGIDAGVGESDLREFEKILLHNAILRWNERA